MSRNLPFHPNLEHLKKQAKDLLRRLKLQNNSLKLADAQNILAHEYGFASWPKLKIYVESLPPRAEEVRAQNPFAGKWETNLLKSKRHPANQFQSATLQFSVDNNTVTIGDVVVDESGQVETDKHTIMVDGIEHPSEQANGYSLIARWRGSRILETLAIKDGNQVGWGKYEVSEDDKTMTISGDEQVIVLDRI